MTLLWNSSAGWSEGGQDARRVREILSGSADVDFVSFKRGADMVRQSRDVVQSGAEILAVAGDDGTVNGVASAVVNRAAREAY